MHDGPEERGEEEAVAEQRARVAPRHPALGQEHVRGVREGAADRRRDAHAAERRAGPDLDDQPETGERAGECDPDPAPDGLVHGVVRKEGDDQRCEVLDQERNAYRQLVDREEVEPLHQCHAADPEGREERELAPRHAQRGRPPDCHRDREPEEGAERAHLRQLERRDPGGENDFRDRAVEPEQRRRDEHHRVADRGAGVPAARARDVGEIDHRPRLSGGAEGVRREHYTAATGRSAAW